MIAIPLRLPERDFSLSKNPFGLFSQFLQSAARIMCLLKADTFHTCSLISIFVHVHAAAKNVFTLFSAYAENSAKLFDRLKRVRIAHPLFIVMTER